jgi:hypothetical protein
VFSRENVEGTKGRIDVHAVYTVDHQEQIQELWQVVHQIGWSEDQPKWRIRSLKRANPFGGRHESDVSELLRIVHVSATTILQGHFLF